MQAKPPSLIFLNVRLGLGTKLDLSYIVSRTNFDQYAEVKEIYCDYPIANYLIHHRILLKVFKVG